MSSAGNRKDVMDLLKQATKNGGSYERVRNGHFRVFNPATGDSATICWSPRSPHYINDARRILRRIGLL